MAMRPLAMLIGLTVLGALTLHGTPAVVIAAPAQDSATAAQRDTQARKSRPRPQIRVNRGYPYRHTHSVYPLPYDVEYPGPNGVRHCVNRYVTERRPSGTVIVPRMRCWWEVRR